MSCSCREQNSLNVYLLQEIRRKESVYRSGGTYAATRGRCMLISLLGVLGLYGYWCIAGLCGFKAQTITPFIFIRAIEVITVMKGPYSYSDHL